MGVGSSVCGELVRSPLAAAELLLGWEERGISPRAWFPQLSTGRGGVCSRSGDCVSHT